MDWFVQPGDSLTLNYFGITNAPGWMMIPEPTTALVLGSRRR